MQNIMRDEEDLGTSDTREYRIEGLDCGVAPAPQHVRNYHTIVGSSDGVVWLHGI